MINVPYIEFWLSSTYHIDKKYNFFGSKIFFFEQFFVVAFLWWFLMGFFYFKKCTWVVLKWLDFLVCENLDI